MTTTPGAAAAALEPGGVPAPAPGGRRARLKLIVILGALSAFGPLSRDLYLPGLPELTDDLGASTSAGQLTLTAALLGLAVGQLLAGPASDALGRRRPLVVGVAAYVVCSALCALAPSVLTLTGLRFVQGLAGGAGIVISRAIVRDLHSGVAAARLFSALLLVNGLAPVLAPVLGGQLLPVTSWRGVFGVLALIGAALLAAAVLGLRETLPPERRRPGGLTRTLATFALLGRDRSFVACALAQGLAFAAMFAYIAGSPFVLQDVYDLSPAAFSACFAVNAVGLVSAGQLSGRLAGRVAPATLMGCGCGLSAVGGVALLAGQAAGGVALVGVLVPFFLAVSAIGLVVPNGTALALEDHPQIAGSASALLGLGQYALGAVAAPLVGVAGEDSVVPLACVMAVCGLGALAAYLGLRATLGRVVAGSTTT